jgi:hypothetical protein
VAVVEAATIRELLVLLNYPDLEYVERKGHRVCHRNGRTACTGDLRGRLESPTLDGLAALLRAEINAKWVEAEKLLLAANNEYRDRTIAARRANVLVPPVAP